MSITAIRISVRSVEGLDFARMDDNVPNAVPAVVPKSVSMIVKNIGAKTAVEKEYAYMNEIKHDVRSAKPFSKQTEKWQLSYERLKNFLNKCLTNFLTVI